MHHANYYIKGPNNDQHWINIDYTYALARESNHRVQHEQYHFRLDVTEITCIQSNMLRFLQTA